MKKHITVFLLLSNLNTFAIDATINGLSGLVQLPFEALTWASHDLSLSLESRKEIINNLKSQSTRYVEFGETTDTLERIFEANPEKSEIEVVENILDLRID